MRFFNIDLHIGVIGDIKKILKSLGHEVTDWTLSSHAWVLGRRPDNVDILNHSTWKTIDRPLCDAFYNRYESELAQYDGFIVTHTPSFAMLYERWRKPIICVASTRYEAPFSGDREKWENFNAFLRGQIDSGMLIPIANNKYDADYAEHFTDRQWRVIPSVCEYTDTVYTGTKSQSLYISKYASWSPPSGVVSKDAYFRKKMLVRLARRLRLPLGKLGYSWRELASFRSVIFIPYNSSIMSIFEMYASGIPMLFPSQRLALELYAEHRHAGAFSELSYSQVYHLPSRSAIPTDSDDPNNYDCVDTMARWIAKSDFYDPENLKHLVYFDSFEELEDLVRKIDVRSIHANMRRHQRIRSARSRDLWAQVIQALPIHAATSK